MSVLKNSERTVLDKFFEELIELRAFETIQIINQLGKSASRPDGEIMSNFQLLIESKTGSGYNPSQAHHHIEPFEENAEKIYGKNRLPEAVKALKKLEESGFHKWEFLGQVIIYYFENTNNLIDKPILREKKGAFIRRPTYKSYKDLKNAKNYRRLNIINQPSTSPPLLKYT